jgi:hypothetical protein
MAKWFLRAFLFRTMKAGASGCDWPCVWTMLLCGLCSLRCSYCLDYVTSMLLYACFYGLSYVVLLWSDYAFAYACFHDTSMGHYMWYLVPCNELSLY